MSSEARLCAKLRKVYRGVMTESANLLACFGDEFGQTLLSQRLSAASLSNGSLLSVVCTVAVVD